MDDLKSHKLQFFKDFSRIGSPIPSKCAYSKPKIVATTYQQISQISISGDGKSSNIAAKMLRYLLRHDAGFQFWKRNTLAVLILSTKSKEFGIFFSYG